MIRAGEVKIRPFRSEDAESFCRNVFCDQSLRESFGLKTEPTYEDAHAYVTERAALNGRPHFYDFVILLDEIAVGEINAAYIAPDLCDAGYVIGSAFRNQGIGAAAMEELKAMLKADGICVLYAACHPENIASQRVMEKAGMKPADQVPFRVRRREESANVIYYRVEL